MFANSKNDNDEDKVFYYTVLGCYYKIKFELKKKHDNQKPRKAIGFKTPNNDIP